MESQADSARESTTRPRLFIKEMVMQNFKSYAGEQRVGPFHKVRFILFFSFNCFNFFNFTCELEIRLNFWFQSFSAVVGPNGSGKSNVIDAMLFVFGKRAKQVCFLECSRK
jgi:structural maintenance of chromosome 4